MEKTTFRSLSVPDTAGDRPVDRLDSARRPPRHGHTPTDSERRRHPRVRNPGVSGRLPTRTEGRLRDLSLSGAGVEAATPLATARSYRLRLHTEEGDLLERQGRLIWSQLTSTRPVREGERIPVYHAGLMFDDTSVTASSALLDFVHSHDPHASNVSEPAGEMAAFEADRTATRYRLGSIRRLELETEYSFTVRSLSLSGMLIETDLYLPPKTEIALVLELPPHELTARSRVVSVTAFRDDEHLHYAVAVEFVGLQPAQQRRLESWLAPNDAA